MTIEKLVNNLADPDVEITVLRYGTDEQIYRGSARGAVQLGYGNYRIVEVNGLVWYW